MIQIERKQTRCCFCSRPVFIPVENEPKQPHHYSCFQNATQAERIKKGFEVNQFDRA